MDSHSEARDVLDALLDPFGCTHFLDEEVSKPFMASHMPTIAAARHGCYAFLKAGQRQTNDQISGN
jgi:hypothetical protein